MFQIASQPSELMLSYLLRRDPNRWWEWTTFAPVARRIAEFLIAKRTPGFPADPIHPRLPSAVFHIAEQLRREEYVDFDESNQRIRLTSLGSRAALLYQLPLELLDEPAVDCETRSTILQKSSVSP